MGFAKSHYKITFTHKNPSKPPQSLTPKKDLPPKSCHDKPHSKKTIFPKNPTPQKNLTTPKELSPKSTTFA
ncbi:hypothetical protein [Helicobacter sp. T3_23-1056]